MHSTSVWLSSRGWFAATLFGATASSKQIKPRKMEVAFTVEILRIVVMAEKQMPMLM